MKKKIKMMEMIWLERRRKKKRFGGGTPSETMTMTERERVLH